VAILPDNWHPCSLQYKTVEIKYDSTVSQFCVLQSFKVNNLFVVTFPNDKVHFKLVQYNKHLCD